MDELRKGIAIGMLFGSGGHGNLMTKTATENGAYTAAEEIDPETGVIFDPPKDGYSVFTVDLALEDKSVSLTTSQITGSQTAEFEYDPHDENPELEGYSLFTIDLSGVKDDIEDLQQQVSDLEDELEDCHDCRDAVVAAIQVYDPDYDPAEGECPAPKVGEIVDHAKDCDDCRDAVVAAIRQYIPTFDPQSCEEIPSAIDAVHDDGLPPIDPTTGQPKHPEGKVPNKSDFDDWIKLNQTPMKDPTRIASNLLEVEFYEKEVRFTTTTVLNCLQMKISWAGEVIWNGHLDSTGTLDAIILDDANFYWRVSGLFLTCNEEQNEKYFTVSKTIRGDFRVNGRGRQSSWSPYSNNTNRFTSEYTADEINNAIQNSQWTIR